MKSSGTGFDTEFNKQFSVYPNPASGYLMISLNNIDINYIEITDVRGKVVLRANSEFDNIDVKGLDNGMYLLNVHTNSGLYIEKLMIAN